MIYPGPILLPAASSGGGGGVTKGFIRTITGTPGAGSTNTGIIRFNNAVRNDSDIVDTDSTTLGTYATLTRDRWYTVTYNASGPSNIAIKKNTTLNNTLATADTDFIGGALAGGTHLGRSVDFYGLAGDLVWITKLGALNNFPNLFWFSITYVE